VNRRQMRRFVRAPHLLFCVRVAHVLDDPHAKLLCACVERLDEQVCVLPEETHEWVSEQYVSERMGR
jgi:hypothetical protein